ncbi:interleukin-18-binding protein-like [Syngnathoides biaculeatus]|uniref:interleukin-18-binding protein-like n=1 Tax=Syngnathoides biaculeatus TaxID=300417 RepID=UPI002ADD6C84|nr:interleukin-18-binding protein-like [Syngnathoides biaculeatus]
MTLSSVIGALLLANASPAVSQYASPTIIGPERLQIKAQPGQPLVLRCAALTNCGGGDDVTLLYWLVNGSFPEDLRGGNRITEFDTSTLEGGAIQTGSLLVRNVTLEDLDATFTCVVINGVGMALKNVTLSAPAH